MLYKILGGSCLEIGIEEVGTVLDGRYYWSLIEYLFVLFYFKLPGENQKVPLNKLCKNINVYNINYTCNWFAYAYVT